MNTIKNLADFPAFLNRPVALPQSHAARASSAQVYAFGSAPSHLLPQTRALLQTLAKRDPLLAQVLDSWQGWNEAQDDRLAA